MRFLKLAMVLACLLFAKGAVAQDTVRVSLQEFIKRGLENSGELEAERQKVNLAQNRVRQTQTKRYLPKFELNSQHGIIPGVKSNREDLDPNEYYLDPNLENDFEDLGLFTRVEVQAVQPIFTWGALRNAVKASQAAATAAEREFLITQNETELRLYNLYQSYLLALETQRLLQEARDQIDQVENALEDQQGEEDSDIDESDVFKFRVFKDEFAIRAAEVEENQKYIQRVWNYVMQGDPNTVYVPEDRFLDPVQNEIKTVDYYKSEAINARPEVRALEAGIEAAEYGVEATQAQQYPSLFIGLSGSYANTPNRPRQSNPFIINNTNYASASIGFGIRQNLDFFSLRYDVKKSKIQLKQVQYSRNAAIDGIVLQVNENYKKASLSKSKIERTDAALTTTRKWVRQEQLDYDFDMGEPKDLIDAIKKELELEVQYKQLIFNFNKDMAELFKSAAIPVTSLQTSYSE